MIYISDKYRCAIKEDVVKIFIDFCERKSITFGIYIK